jgi:N-methylhydantoinase B
VKDTEGAGRHRGAPSLFVEYGPVDCEIEAGYVSDGYTNKALGARGGGTGGGSEQFKRTADGTLEPLPPFAQLVIGRGETIISISCGGGGYGPPEERDPERVRHDVAEGWISRERAAEVYRVAVREDGTIDHQDTERLRTD